MTAILCCALCFAVYIFCEKLYTEIRRLSAVLCAVLCGLPH